LTDVCVTVSVASCQSEYASNYLEPWKLVPRRTVPVAAAAAAAAAGDDKLHHSDEQSQVLKLPIFLLFTAHQLFFVFILLFSGHVCSTELLASEANC